ncbi:hypothetical protein JCM6882_009423 [Rhodosporidiobolus microsporus]
MARGRKVLRRTQPAAAQGPPRPPPAYYEQAIPNEHSAEFGEGSAGSNAMAEAARARYAAEHGIDPQSVDVQAIHGEQHSPLRAHCHKVGCIAFRSSGMSFREWNARVYEPWLARSYGPDVRPWYAGKPSGVFSKYADGEFGRAVVQQHLELGAQYIARLREMLSILNIDGPFFLKWEHSLTQDEREDIVLRTLKRPLVATEKFRTGHTRDEAPELTLERMTTGQHFQKLCLALIPPEGSSEPWRTVRSPGGVWERLQDPEDVSVTPRRLGVTAGTRVWVADGQVRRHVALIVFCLGVLETIAGRSEEELAVAGIARAPNMTEAAREAYSTSVAGHEATPPMIRPDALKVCINCHHVEKDKKFTCCARCKEAVNRHHYYCSRECQVADWKVQHKQICGRLLADIMKLSHEEKQPAELKKAVLAALPKHPRAVMLVPAGAQPESDNDILFHLPTFVRPFRETLAEMTAISTRALKERDDLSIGIVLAFVRLSAPYVDAGAESAVDSLRKFACRLFEVNDETLDEMEKVAEGELEQREEYELVKSCFEQLKTGNPDASFPDLTMADTSLFIFDTLEQNPNAWFAMDMVTLFRDDVRATQAPQVNPMTLPPFFEPREPTLAALRALAYRVLETIRDCDPLDLGLLHLAFTISKHFGLSYVESQYNPTLCAEMCTALVCMSLELDGAMLEDLLFETWAKLDDFEDQDDDERWLIGNFIRWCDENAKTPWPKSRPSAASKKKRNKKKKGKKAVLAPEETADVDEVVDGQEE